MLEGKRFLPLTGIPILNSARSRHVFAVWLPDPFTVAATITKLFTPAGLSLISLACGPLCTLVILIDETAFLPLCVPRASIAIEAGLGTRLARHRARAAVSISLPERYT